MGEQRGHQVSQRNLDTGNARVFRHDERSRSHCWRQQEASGRGGDLCSAGEGAAVAKALHGRNGFALVVTTSDVGQPERVPSNLEEMTVIGAVVGDSGAGMGCFWRRVGSYSDQGP